MGDINIYNVFMLITFVVGYFFITIENFSKINKTSIALLTAIICWVFVFIQTPHTTEDNLNFLSKHLANISQVIFFLLGGLTIVEIISAHKGFQLIARRIRSRSKSKLLWIIGLISFFLSSILDNLTTTIIMVTLLRKITKAGSDRLLLGGMVVIAANAGGAWTPIGDVTTTMLWIGGQLTTFAIIKNLFLPSLVCLIASLCFLQCTWKGELETIKESPEEVQIEPYGNLIFWLGIVCLLFVPFFKVITGLPPFMGMIFGLGIMWLLTDLIHARFDDREHLRVPHIMTQIDVSGVLFFLGILLSVDALHTAGILDTLAHWMDRKIGSEKLIAIAIGLVSAIVDNVPLVAATMGMYSLTEFPIDSHFWNLIAYCAGTGGSVLVIGSSAGVAFMGLEKVDFFWYARKIGFAALLGYFAGVIIFEFFSFF